MKTADIGSFCIPPTDKPHAHSSRPIRPDRYLPLRPTPARPHRARHAHRRCWLRLRPQPRLSDARRLRSVRRGYRPARHRRRSPRRRTSASRRSSRCRSPMPLPMSCSPAPSSTSPATTLSSMPCSRGAWRILKPGGLFFCRLASSIGIEHLIERRAGRRFLLPDRSERYLVDEALLMHLTEQLGGELLDPIKTTVVQNQRSMTTWVLRKAG